MVMHGESRRGSQMDTLLFVFAVAVIVLSVALFIGGLCWVMTQM
jgi:heme/copper-type cytochrome/quinol oxidase subunit 4